MFDTLVGRMFSVFPTVVGIATVLLNVVITVEIVVMVVTVLVVTIVEVGLKLSSIPELVAMTGGGNVELNPDEFK
jgi:hypothetical protein